MIARAALTSLSARGSTCCPVLSGLSPVIVSNHSTTLLFRSFDIVNTIQKQTIHLAERKKTVEKLATRQVERENQHQLRIERKRLSVNSIQEIQP